MSLPKVFPRRQSRGTQRIIKRACYQLDCRHHQQRKGDGALSRVSGAAQIPLLRPENAGREEEAMGGGGGRGGRVIHNRPAQLALIKQYDASEGYLNCRRSCSPDVISAGGTKVGTEFQTFTWVNFNTVLFMIPHQQVFQNNAHIFQSSGLKNVTSFITKLEDLKQSQRV